jgi:RNA polymerase sigma-70 factor (ECF subfamily)
MRHDDGAVPGPPALEAAFHAYYAPLCEFVYRYVQTREIAHDLVQDLFLRLWELTEAPNPPTLSAAYLYCAARNRALKYLRHERVVTRWQAWATEQGQGDASTAVAAAADAEFEGRELAAAVDQAIAELPERCRLVFTLSRQQDLPNAEIAAVLGISVKTVEAQMSKALKTLRRKLALYLPT